MVKKLKLHRLKSILKSFIMRMVIDETMYHDYFLVGENCYGMYYRGDFELFVESKQITEICGLDYNENNTNLIHELVREIIIPKLTNKLNIKITNL